jgi:hypothetical protein
LQADPHELRNLAALPQYAAEVRRFRRHLDEWILTTGDRGAIAETQEEYDRYRG